MGYSQTKPCPNKYGEDTARTKRDLTLFNKYYKSKDYIKAYPYWRYLFDNAPCVQKRITYNGPNVVKKVLRDLKKNDSAGYADRKDHLIDTILMIYPKRIEYYGQEGYVLGKWASDLGNLRPKQRQEALKMFERSIELTGNKASYTVPQNFIKTAVKEHVKKRYTLDSLYTLYFQMMDIVGYNLANDTKKHEKWEATEAYINKAMKPYLNCEKVEEYFKPLVEAAPNDTVLLKKVADLLINAKCERSLFFLSIAEKIYELDPSPAAAFTIAVGRHANKEYSDAVNWYSKSIDSAPDDTSKAKIYLTIANLYDKRLSNTSAANKAANKALELDPKLGAAYLIKAKYIGSLSGSCADGIQGKSAFWAASDAARKAKEIDPGVEKSANALINFYYSKFITKEDAFLLGFIQDEGTSFTVPCTGSSTIVRFRKK